MTLDELYGEGATDRLAQLMGSNPERVGESGLRWWLENGYLEVMVHQDQFYFTAYTAQGYLAGICAAFGTWGVERGIDQFHLTYYGPDSAAAYQRIGFLPAGGSEMVTTPARVKEYGDWRIGAGAEPEWHLPFSEQEVSA